MSFLTSKQCLRKKTQVIENIIKKWRSSPSPSLSTQWPPVRVFLSTAFNEIGEGVSRFWRCYSLLALLFVFFASVCTMPSGVRDIIGTTNVQYQDLNQVFPKGASVARGFVRLNQGVTVASLGTAQLDTFITVSGSLDIRMTGTVDLLSDLYLSSNFTFSSSDFIGGSIKGRGKVIHLGGDTLLQRSQTFKFIGDTIIDGGGNTLIFDPYAQLMVDHGVTLTLSNMCLINYRSSQARPPINLLSQSSKLALKNVTMLLLDNFSFNEGSLFIHGDVTVTGTSMFAYRSAAPCYIDRQASWLFDREATYFHTPKTNVNNQLYMGDATSALVFDNATLLTTHTGMRIARGLVCLDNGVTFSSTANTRFFNLAALGTPVTDVNSSAINAACWSRDGQYFAGAAVDLSTATRLEVSTFNGTNLVNEQDYVDNNFVLPSAIDWSWDNRFIVVGGEDINGMGVVRAYRFTGTSVVPHGDALVNANFAHIYGIAWSIDGNYVVAVGQDAGFAFSRYAIYRFNGESLSLVSTATDTDFYSIQSISWHPNGRYFLLGGYGAGSGKLKVCSFTSGSFTTVGTLFNAINFVFVNSCSWSPDGKFVMVGGQDISVFAYGQTQLLAFNGSSLSTVATSFNASNFSNIFSVAWASDGRRIVAGGLGNVGCLIQTYQFNGGLISTVGSLINNANLSTIGSVVWSPDNRTIAVAGTSIANEGLTTLYKATYGYDTSPQSFTNGIVFGNAALGALYDLNVQVFGGARVVIDGKLLYDNVS